MRPTASSPCSRGNDIPLGMHHGIIAATTSLERMLAELRRQAGRFELDEPLDSPYDALDGDLAIGEHDGRCYVLDNRTTLLSDNPDMVHRMSVELGLVVAAGADTMFGAYWFTAARDGELLRYVYVNAESLAQGLAMEQELPSESRHPIDGDWDGTGLFAAMACLGVDPRPWLKPDQPNY